MRVQLDIRNALHFTYPRSSRPLAVPATTVETAEDNGVATVGKGQLEVAAPQRRRRPPTVFDHPLLANRRYRDAGNGAWDSVIIGDHRHRPGNIEAAHVSGHDGTPQSSGKGVSTAQRSGTRETESTGNTLSSASAPCAARTSRTASPRRRRRGSSPPTER